LVNFPDKKIKEEVGQFMILMSDEIDDPAGILEIQKFNLHKIENDEDKKVEINFYTEPRKSKKQLRKIINVIQKFCADGDVAQLVLDVYGRKTSVLYDLAAITDQL
jgi:hypothetical protein